MILPRGTPYLYPTLIFTKDFSNELPSRLRILNAPSLETDQRYRGKKVSRKTIQSDSDDLDDLENESEDSEDEAMGEKEHEQAELGHMFVMAGVDYDDEEEDPKSKKVCAPCQQ